MADIIISPLSVTKERNQLIDFSMVILVNEPVFATKLLPSYPPITNLWVYFDPFTVLTWMAFLLTIGVLAFSLYSFSYFATGLLTILTQILGLLIQRQPELSFGSAPLRLLHFMTAIWALFLFTAYNGNLTSTMTIQGRPPDIFTLQHILAQKRHLVVWKSTALYDRIKEAPQGTIKDKIFDYLINADYQSFITSSEELFEAFKKDSTIIYFGETLDVYPNDGIQFTEAGFEPKSINAFGLQKNSDIKCSFDYQLLKLMNLGLLEKLQTKWMRKKKHQVEGRSTETNALGFENTLFPFLLLGIGMSLAGFVAITEFFLVFMHIKQ